MIPDRFYQRLHGKFSIRQFYDRTFLTFILVGCSNFAVSFAVFWLCMRTPVVFPFKSSVAQLISYATGTFWSFFWNRRLTFRSSGAVYRQAVRFISLQVSLAIISALLIGFIVENLGMNPSITWLIVMSAVTPTNFLLSKWWAFK